MLSSMLFQRGEMRPRQNGSIRQNQIFQAGVLKRLNSVSQTGLNHLFRIVAPEIDVVFRKNVEPVPCQLLSLFHENKKS